MTYQPIGTPKLTFLGEVRRGTVWSLETPEKKLELFVSSGGRSLRVWDPKAKKELK